jgi:cell division septum initiation protein DivIVA
MKQMDLIERIEELQVLVEEAKSVPLSTSAVINRDEILELLAALKQEIPEEIRQARWMARDRDELLARARKEAERIIAEAREQRDRLLSRTEIVQAAQQESDRIVQEAKDKAARLQHEAEDYIDQKLAGFEILLNKTLGTIGRGREQLRGRTTSSPTAAIISGEQAMVPGDQQAPFDADSEYVEPGF